MTAPLLTVDHVSMRFGGLLAVNDVSFSAAPQAITAVIGPNGAGKTTLFNCLTGFYRPTEGTMRLDAGGRVFQLEKLSGWRVAADAGIVRTFQNIRLFPGLTVLENLLVAQHRALMRASAFCLAGLLGLPSWRRAEKAAVGLAMSWLERFGLADHADSLAGSLPYGAQRKAEIARALCLGPRLLCLDEPAAGLNPRETAELADTLRWLRDEIKLTLLLIEHDMGLVMRISDHIVVLDHGEKIAQGTPDQVCRDPEVIRAYLGDDPLADSKGGAA